MHLACSVVVCGTKSPLTQSRSRLPGALTANITSSLGHFHHAEEPTSLTAPTSSLHYSGQITGDWQGPR